MYGGHEDVPMKSHVTFFPSRSIQRFRNHPYRCFLANPGEEDGRTQDRAPSGIPQTGYIHLPPSSTPEEGAREGSRACRKGGGHGAGGAAGVTGRLQEVAALEEVHRSPQHVPRHRELGEGGRMSPGVTNGV